jgi:hypothetical protein
LFSAATYGDSGWSVRFALLRPGTGKELDNIFLRDVTVSSQNQHGFRTESAISDAPVFLTADYVWGPDESRLGSHRYIVSAYVYKPAMPGGGSYCLQDRYMTVRQYDDPEMGADILAAEKDEILARLRRVKAAQR